jgi:acyl-CoA thioester hydrolase
MPQFRDNLPADARTFEARAQVQWADVDIAGIIYFVAYWRFQELAEMELFRAIGFPYEEVFKNAEFHIPRIHTEATFYNPALMGDRLRMRLHVTKVGASSVSWQTVVFNETSGQVAAALSLTVACMNAQTRKSMPLPPKMREALLAVLASGGDTTP